MKIGRIERIRAKSGPQLIGDADTPQQLVEPEQTAEPPLPEFPRLVGPLDDFIRSITHDLPYEYKAVCALAWAGLEMSGCVQLATDPFLQPRFYACMIGPPGTGKSASEKEVRRALGPCFPQIHVEYSVDSGPALIERPRSITGSYFLRTNSRICLKKPGKPRMPTIRFSASCCAYTSRTRQDGAS